ncbi:hypothetical protein [Zhongshania sp.]|uniref:hypothetical protein n=1 Tax=Zhongshania sp. TaxID=1971902 RepID=UPI001B480CA9|nr:hypothetical protein [Zhongshania sp.]MBQ0797553.1 hypothetical protein [Zhongshania sp.]
MADANHTKTNRLPGGINFDPSMSGGDLFDDGFAVLGCATEQIKQAANKLFESTDDDAQNVATCLYGAICLAEIAHNMLFTASERKYLEETQL